MNNNEDETVEVETLKLEDIDIIGSIEFDLSESMKDLFYEIKQLRNDVDSIKEHIHLSK